MTTKALNQRQVRWAGFLSQLNFVTTYRPGSKATLPSSLSRLPGLKAKDASDERLRPLALGVTAPEKLYPTVLEELLNEPHSCTRDGKTLESILVVIDRPTKMRHFVPVTGRTSEELVDGFIRHIYRLHSAPDTIVSDRGRESVPDFWRRLNERLKMTLRHSSPWNPETDGAVQSKTLALCRPELAPRYEKNIYRCEGFSVRSLHRTTTNWLAPSLDQPPHSRL